MTWNVRIFISPPFQRISITNRVLSLFDCFTTYYNCMTWTFKKLISDISVHKDHKSCSYFIWPFYDLLQHYDIKCQKPHIFTILVQKYHKSCSFLIWPFYSLLQPYDLKCQKTHISAISVHKYHKVFFSLFDRVTTYYNCMTWIVRKLISPPFQCTSITNRVFRLFHPLMAYYIIRTLNFLKNHISAI